MEVELTSDQKAFLLSLDEAKASLVGGNGCEITRESMRELASEVKARLLLDMASSHG